MKSGRERAVGRRLEHRVRVDDLWRERETGLLWRVFETWHFEHSSANPSVRAVCIDLRTRGTREYAKLVSRYLVSVGESRRRLSEDRFLRLFDRIEEDA